MKRLAILWMLSALLVVGCGSVSAIKTGVTSGTGPSQTEHAAVVVVRQFLDAISQGDVDAVLALYHPDCDVHWDLANHQQLAWLRGSVGHWITPLASLQKFPDFRLDVQEVSLKAEGTRECVVDFAFTYGATDPTTGPTVKSVSAELHLAKYQGTWKIWDWDSASRDIPTSSSEPAGPPAGQ